MHGRTQVGESNSAYVSKWDFESRTGRRYLQLLKDSFNQIVVLAPSASIEVSN